MQSLTQCSSWMVSRHPVSAGQTLSRWGPNTSDAALLQTQSTCQGWVALMELCWLPLLLCILTLELMIRGKAWRTFLDALGTYIVLNVMLAG